MTPVGTSTFNKVRVTVIAVNILMNTPINNIVAKPTMILAPKLLPKKYNTAQEIIVATFESRIEGQARFQPTAIAEDNDRPSRSSSLTRSKTRMLASAAMPIERINPAIPARVSVPTSLLN